MANERNYVKNDRFGRPYQLRFAPQVITKDGEEIDAYSTYFELGGKSYKVEFSNANKTKTIRGVDRAGMWAKITKVEKQKINTSM